MLNNQALNYYIYRLFVLLKYEMYLQINIGLFVTYTFRDVLQKYTWNNIKTLLLLYHSGEWNLDEFNSIPTIF